jgi:hypothetical protein
VVADQLIQQAAALPRLSRPPRDHHQVSATGKRAKRAPAGAS